MPLFFFRFDQDDPASPDTDGLDLVSLDAARAQAFTALAEMARDEAAMPGGEHHIACTIKDANQADLYRLELSIRCRPV